jgi:hypothetical protein
MSLTKLSLAVIFWLGMGKSLTIFYSVEHIVRSDVKCGHVLSKVSTKFH